MVPFGTSSLWYNQSCRYKQAKHTFINILTKVHNLRVVSIVFCSDGELQTRVTFAVVQL